MTHYIEEIVRTGRIKPLRLIGTAWGVFRMIRVLAEFHPYHRDSLEWDCWLVNKEN